jgi:hypothetical protein
VTLHLLWAFLVGSGSGVLSALLTARAIRCSERNRMIDKALEENR